jgi:hypothetical protein
VIRGRHVDAPGLQSGTILRDQDGHFSMPPQDFRKLAGNG